MRVHMISSNHISYTDGTSLSGANQTQTTLAILENEMTAIQSKILKNVNGSPQTRRRAWARNKSTILKLRDDLKESRDNLIAALSANNSWEFLILLWESLFG